MTTRWQVQIIRHDGRPKTFSTHDNRTSAEVEARKLRRHGLWSRVRVVNQVDEPEHRNERRAFLIFACMLGAVPPERVVERIVAELEREARATS